MIRVDVTQRTRTVLLTVPKQSGLHREGMRLAWHDIGKLVGKKVKRLIETGPKTGRKWPNLPNRSSAPGQPPANQFGRLVKSYNYKVKNWQNMTVGESARYADFLERGTRKMRPRPHMIVAVNLTAGDVINMMYQRSAEQLKNG